MKHIIWIFILLSTQVLAQNKAAFYANASSLEVVQGSNFRVEFIMNNIKASNFTPPAFDHFEVLSGPNRTSSYTNTNGRASQQNSISYDLQAIKEGKYKIRAAYCTYNGQKLATTPFDITVLKRDSKSLEDLGLPTDKDIFVRLEVASDTAYMGQRVVLQYKLYNRKEVRSYDMKAESDYAGFFSIRSRSKNKNAVQETIDGEVYSTQVLEERSLYPQQTGTFEIEGARLNLGLPDANKQKRGFFFNSRVKQFPVETNALTLHVVDLPSGAPPSFSGAVGSFQMQAAINKSKLSTDDALTLTITVAGNGDAKYILPPSQTHLKDFEIYDPSTIEKGEREMYGEIQTVKAFEYLVVPKKAGRQNIQARFAYFDPKKREYVTLGSKNYPLLVEQGSAKAKINIEQSDESNRELTALLPKIKLHNKGKGLFGGPLHMSLLGLSLLGVGFIFYKKRQNDIEAGIDPLLKKRSKAQAIAEKRLSAAQEFMKSENHRSFYEEISRSMLGFIADKLNVPNSEISKSNVAARLGSEGIEAEKIAQVTEVLSKAEVAVFAGKKDGDLQQVYNQTRDLISYLSEKI